MDGAAQVMWAVLPWDGGASGGSLEHEASSMVNARPALRIQARSSRCPRTSYPIRDAKTAAGVAATR